MPLHNWTDDRGWDSVHPIWLTYLIEWVQPRLPEGYKVLIVLIDPQRAIHIDFHGQLVAAIELVSPRNKDRTDAKETYTSRYLGYLRLGVHLLLVDVLPRPRGFSFADAITSGLGADLPPLPSPFAAAYRVGEVVPVGEDMGSLLGVWRRPLEIGQPLPTLPLPLSVHQSVMIDLEQTYQRAAERAYL